MLKSSYHNQVILPHKTSEGRGQATNFSAPDHMKNGKENVGDIENHEGERNEKETNSWKKDCKRNMQKGEEKFLVQPRCPYPHPQPPMKKKMKKTKQPLKCGQILRTVSGQELLNFSVSLHTKNKIVNKESWGERNMSKTERGSKAREEKRRARDKER